MAKKSVTISLIYLCPEYPRLLIKVERIRKYVGYISMDSVFCAEFSLNNAHCMHVGQTYIMFCVSIETRLWKAEQKKTVDKGCCYILNNRYPLCEWSSLAFVQQVLFCSTRVVCGLGGSLYLSEQYSCLYSKCSEIPFIFSSFIIHLLFLSFTYYLSSIFLAISFIHSSICLPFYSSFISIIVHSFIH
jgi:hypothetical protein